MTDAKPLACEMYAVFYSAKVATLKTQHVE